MNYIGIDLGTTNSLCALMQDNKPELVTNVHGEVLTPSVIGVDTDGSILVGKSAKERLRLYPDTTVQCFKRSMGTKNVFHLGKHAFRPEELSSLVLQSLKNDAEAYCGGRVSEAVISVPAYFNDSQRAATCVAANLAGLDVIRLINEPTAAALAYGHFNVQEELQFMVLDLGGGTFDVSLLEVFEDVYEVHASAGDNFLGGEDFTQVISENILSSLQINKNNLKADQINQLYITAEKLKRRLTLNQTATESIRIGDIEREYKLDRETFEKLSEPLINKMLLPIRQALRDASISADSLDDVILVGGGTRVPAVRSLASRIFKRIPSATIDPDTVVALGTAIQASLVKRQKQIKEVVLTDVAPYTLGVEVSEQHQRGGFKAGYFLPIIERNSKIPTSRAETLSTLHNYQKAMHITVYQGESRLVKNNLLLGELTIEVPENQAGLESVEVRYTYNVNGLLEVQCKVISTGIIKSLVIQNSDSRLSDTEVQDSLAKIQHLKIHPRETQQVRTAMAKAERLYETLLAENRDAVKNSIRHFEDVLDTQNANLVEEELAKFLSFLDSIENEHLW